MSWPDLLLGGIALVAALKGYKRGFVSELAGFLALVASFVTPWFYNGAFDGAIARTVHVAAGSAHVIGLFLTGVATYVAVLILARILNAVAKLPVLGLGNALAGGAVGLMKAIAGIWLLLYVALLFPLSPDLRADLHRSAMVQWLTAPDQRIDGAITATLPWFARPFAHSYFSRHRV